MAIRLVENWRDAWKWFSINAMVLAGAIQAVWLSLPDDMKATVHPKIVAALTVALMIFGICGRVVKQSDKPNA